jgi:hypothetical protein
MKRKEWETIINKIKIIVSEELDESFILKKETSSNKSVTKLNFNHSKKIYGIGLVFLGVYGYTNVLRIKLYEKEFSGERELKSKIIDIEHTNEIIKITRDYKKEIQLKSLFKKAN